MALLEQDNDKDDTFLKKLEVQLRGKKTQTRIKQAQTPPQKYKANPITKLGGMCFISAQEDRVTQASTCNNCRGKKSSRSEKEDRNKQQNKKIKKKKHQNKITKTLL